MIKYEIKKINKLNEKVRDKLYKDLLLNKWHFLILDMNDDKFVLTKEGSLFQIDNIDKFIDDADNDIYYRTEIVNNSDVINKESLEIFKKYINKYRDEIEKNLYGGKYLFGSIAVRINENEFITTIRGKENLEDYTIVKKVDHNKHIVYVDEKKATLNAPLLDTLFNNKDVKVIVHINHKYDNSLKSYEYAFPGTVRDSNRDNDTSFNIKHHGLFYLINDKDEIIKKEVDNNEIS